MPRKGENIYKRKDGRWEGRFIKSYNDYVIGLTRVKSARSRQIC